MNLYESIKKNLKSLNESQKLNEADDQYKQKFIDYCKGKIKDLGSVDIKGEDVIGYTFLDDEDEDKIFTIRIDCDFGDNYKALDGEDTFNAFELENSYLSNGKFVDGGQMDAGLLWHLAEMNFKYIDTDFYKELLDNWENWEMSMRLEEVELDNESRLNESEKLKEADYKIWSNHGQEEYYENMSREEMIEEIKNNGWDEEEINGEPILNAEDDVLREYLIPQDIDLDYEDFDQSILPMIENQCYNDELVLTGIAANWRGRGEACKAIKTKDLQDYFFPNYDATIQLYCDSQDDLYYTEANHDTPMGGTEMYLYSFKDETAYNNAEKLLQELYEDENWDMYYFDDWAGYDDVQKLIEQGFLTPVKRNPQYVGRINESESLKESSYTLEPKYDSAQSFYGKARVEQDGDAYTLISYTTPILTVRDGNIEVLCDEWAFTQTTLRHVREFLRQMEDDGKVDLSSKDHKLSTKKWLLSLRGE